MNEDKDNLESEANEQSSEAGVVCTACLEINPQHTNYCAKCGAPLNSLVAFNPFDQTLIEGFAYRRAVDGPPSKIILVGMWLVFAPGLFALPVTFRLDFASLASASDFIGWLFGHAYLGAYFILSVLILYRTTANYFAKRSSNESGNASSGTGISGS